MRTRDGVGAVDFFLSQKIEMSCFRLMFFCSVRKVDKPLLGLGMNLFHLVESIDQL